jgi:hypothetical protein
MNEPVAVDWAAYVDSTAAAIGLAIDPAYRAGVIANLERIAQVAQVVNAIELADTDEAAGVYRP